MSFALPAATEGTFEQCPQGLFVFKLKSMQDGIEGREEFGGGERVKWVFEITRVIDANENEPTRDVPDPKPIDDWIGEEFWAFTSKSMNSKATMRAWAEALLGREIADGEALNASDLLGRSAKATVGRGQTGRQKITSMMPLKKAGKPKPPPVEEYDEEDDELGF